MDCIVLYCNGQYCIVLFCEGQYCIAFECNVLDCIVMNCTVLYWSYMERFGNVQPLDETGLTHRHNFLLCVAVLRLYRGGPVMCCALTVNRLLITIIIIIGFQSAPSQISSRRVHFLPNFKKKKKGSFNCVTITLYRHRTPKWRTRSSCQL